MNSIIKKAFTLSLSIAFLGTVAHAQKRSKSYNKLSQHHTHATVGFYSGAKLFDVGNTGYKRKKYSEMSTGFFVRMPIVTHFKAETGLQYSNMLSAFAPSNHGKPGTIAGGSNLSIPVTIQYYPRNERKKLQPFFGVGTMINTSNNRTSVNPNGEQSYLPAPNGTKYISILFTQGVTFAISTKINVTETIQYMPDNDKNIIGVSVGVGFHMP